MDKRALFPPSAERPIVSRFDTRGKASEMTPKEPLGSNEQSKYYESYVCEPHIAFDPLLLPIFSLDSLKHCEV